MTDISKVMGGFGYQIRWNPEKGQNLSPQKELFIRIGQRSFTPSGGGVLGTLAHMQAIQ